MRSSAPQHPTARALSCCVEARLAELVKMQPRELPMREKLSNVMHLPFRQLGDGVLRLARLEWEHESELYYAHKIQVL